MTTENLTYEHKGVKIAAMKKVIDSGVKDRMAYEPPVTMLALHPQTQYSHKRRHLENSQRPIEDYRVQVTRLLKSKRRWTNHPYSFQTDRGESHELIADTPENFAKIIAFWKAHEAEGERARAAQAEVDKLLEAIPITAAEEAARLKGVT